MAREVEPLPRIWEALALVLKTTNQTKQKLGLQSFFCFSLDPWCEHPWDRREAAELIGMGATGARREAEILQESSRAVGKGLPLSESMLCLMEPVFRLLI